MTFDRIKAIASTMYFRRGIAIGLYLLAWAVCGENNPDYLAGVPFILLDFGGGASAMASASTQAAQIQAAATERAAQLQMQMYQQSAARLQPWVGAGTSALGQYAGLLGLPGYDRVDPTAYLRSTPGYQFTLNEGIGALDRSAAARGMVMSGAQNRAVTQYATGLADQTYGALMDRLYGVSGSGQNAAAMTGTMGQGTAQNMGALYMQGAQAQAQGLMNSAGYRAQGNNAMWGNILGGVGMLGSALTAPLGIGGVLGMGGSLMGSLFQ